MRLKSWSLLAALWCGACHNPVAADRPTTVQFVLVAPLCSSVLPVEFFVDARSVGVDTFRVAVSAPHVVSRAFTVSPGVHALSANVLGGYVWPPHTVSVPAGTTVSDSLPFYCS